jgi:hypothetical protein
MISLLCPTRNRRAELSRLASSIEDTMREANLELICYVDEDDQGSCDCISASWIRFIRGPRIVLSDMWNKCAERARGEILMMMADDCVFRTPGWDAMIRIAFEDSYLDNIVMVHGSDGRNADNFGVFPTIHRKWFETTGYFVPPYFVGDFSDTWLNDVANALGRRKYLPYLTEHLHWTHGKAPVDSTYQERLDREKKENPAVLYASLEKQRQQDISKLRAVMR